MNALHRIGGASATLAPSEAAPAGAPKCLTHRVALTLLLILGAAALVHKAWCLRYNVDPDSGIVGLMVRHMLAGRDFPLFFYGQAYMGSLEPMVSAVFCALFGYSRFVLNLGPALISFGLLIVVYLWARDAAGRRAGLAALAFTIVGSDFYSEMSILPRGGYPTVLLLGTLLVWISVRVVTREQEDGVLRAGAAGLLGVLAGLGLWTDMLIASALLTAGFVFLAGLRLRALRPRRLAWGLAGFVLGSSPLWLWNVFHEWASFSFVATLDTHSWLWRLSDLFSGTLVTLLGYSKAPGGIKWIGLGLTALLVALALMTMAGRRKIQPPPCVVTGLLAALALLLSTGVLYCFSTLGPDSGTRYLLPAIPALAVLVGVGADAMVRRIGPIVGWLPLLALLAWQARAPYDTHVRSQHMRIVDDNVQALGAFLDQNAIQAVYVPYQWHALNFILGERMIFTSTDRFIDGFERYAPYQRAMTQATRVAVLNNQGDIQSFLDGCGGSARAVNVGGFQAHLDFVAPPAAVGGCDTMRWTAATDAHGVSQLGVLTDGDPRTGWQGSCGGTEAEWIEVELSVPCRLSGLRLLTNAPDRYPPLWQVEGRGVADEAWRPLTGEVATTTYRWSDGRPRWEATLVCLAPRFAPTELTRLRFTALPDPRGGTGSWNITEIQPLVPADVRGQPLL